MALNPQGGAVGIGTTNPNETLQVIGNGRFQGSVKVDAEASAPNEGGQLNLYASDNGSNDGFWGFDSFYSGEENFVFSTPEAQVPLLL